MDKQSNCVNNQTEMAMEAKKQVPSLGRFEEFGRLYSAYIEDFIPGTNLFKNDVIEDQYKANETKRTDVEYIKGSFMSEKLDSEEFTAEVKLCLLTGVLGVKGAANYLKGKQTNANSLEMTLKYCSKTVNQSIKNIKRMEIDEELLKEENATHVVVGIDWGARCNISCTLENTTCKSEKEFKAEFDAMVEFIQVEAKAEGGACNIVRKVEKNMTIKVESDVLNPNDVPTTFNEAVKAAKNMPKEIAKINGGKGIHLEYTLMPLYTVARLCGKDFQSKRILAGIIEENDANKCVELCLKISETKRAVLTMLKTMKRNKDFFEETEISTAESLCNDAESIEHDFKDNAKDHLFKVKTGRSESFALTELVTETKSQLSHVQEKYQTHLAIVQKRLHIIQSLQLKNVSFYGKKNPFRPSPNGAMFVLCLKVNDAGGDDNINDHIDYFKRLITPKEQIAEDDQPVVIQAAVEITDFLQAGQQFTIIKKFLDGAEVEDNLLKKEKKRLKLCCIKVPLAKIEKKEKKFCGEDSPTICCPYSYKENSCDTSEVNWYHEKCMEQIFYNPDTKFIHCHCGRFKLKDAKFRCNDPKHGKEYYPATERFLTDLDEQKIKKIKNILILGETGVGKTTWINSIVYYLSYTSVNEALKSKYQCLPIQLLSSDNQLRNNSGKSLVQKFGETRTLEPISYLIKINGVKYRFIDTPGFGDIRGNEQDEKHFEMIKEHLTFCDKIHGICIVLKPKNDEAAMKKLLWFSIEQLLAHLNKSHGSAASNIVFCFTNCHEILYELEEARSILQKHLKEYEDIKIEKDINTFCFDNELFHSLSSYQKVSPFIRKRYSREKIKAFSESWQKSVLETKKLFNYIDKEPIGIENIENPNRTNDEFLQFGKPLVAVLNIILLNMEQIGNLILQLEEAIKQGNYPVQVHLKQFGLKTVELKQPKTICTDKDCQQVCHEPCFLKGFPCGVQKDERIKECWCIKSTGSDFCRECGHRWTHHEHLTYKLKITKEEKEINPELYEDKENFYKRVLRNLAEDVKTLEEELEKILKTTGALSSFIEVTCSKQKSDNVEILLRARVNKENAKIRESHVQSHISHKAEVNEELDDCCLCNFWKCKDSAQKSKQKRYQKHLEKLLTDLYDLSKNGKTIKRILMEVQEYGKNYKLHDFREVPIPFFHHAIDKVDGVGNVPNSKNIEKFEHLIFKVQIQPYFSAPMRFFKLFVDQRYVRIPLGKKKRKKLCFNFTEDELKTSIC